MTALVYVLIILILIGIAVQISKNILRKEFGLHDEAGGEFYKRIRKRCLVLGCRNKATIFFGWRAGVCRKHYDGYVKCFSYFYNGFKPVHSRHHNIHYN